VCPPLIYGYFGKKSYISFIPLRKLLINTFISPIPMYSTLYHRCMLWWYIINLNRRPFEIVVHGGMSTVKESFLRKLSQFHELQELI
jgi:hypothetical protein